MLVLCSVASAQVDVVYPYNPDVEPDGHIGVNDLLALLPIFGQEFEVSVVDNDTSSAVVMVSGSATWWECKQQCSSLGRGWDMIGLDKTALFMDTLVDVFFTQNEYDYDSKWWLNELWEVQPTFYAGAHLNGSSPMDTAFYHTIYTTQFSQLNTCWCETEVRPEIEYQLLNANTGVLQDLVQDAIDEGWLPLGGVGGAGLPIQAMWRYAE